MSSLEEVSHCQYEDLWCVGHIIPRPGHGQLTLCLADAASANLLENAAQLEHLRSALHDSQQQLEQTKEQLQAKSTAAVEGQKQAEQRQQELDCLGVAHKALQKVGTSGCQTCSLLCSSTVSDAAIMCTIRSEQC